MIITIPTMLSSLKIVSPWDENASLPLLLIVYSVQWQRMLSKDHFYLGQNQSVSVSISLALPLLPLLLSLPPLAHISGRADEEKRNQRRARDLDRIKPTHISRSSFGGL